MEEIVLLIFNLFIRHLMSIVLSILQISQILSFNMFTVSYFHKFNLLILECSMLIQQLLNYSRIWGAHMMELL